MLAGEWQDVGKGLLWVELDVLRNVHQSGCGKTRFTPVPLVLPGSVHEAWQKRNAVSAAEYGNRKASDPSCISLSGGSMMAT